MAIRGSHLGVAVPWATLGRSTGCQRSQSRARAPPVASGARASCRAHSTGCGPLGASHAPRL